MGVLNCNRNGCENIMCDYCSSEYGYICWECLCELEKKIEKGTVKSITEFMNSRKELEHKDDLDITTFRYR